MMLASSPPPQSQSHSAAAVPRTSSLTAHMQSSRPSFDVTTLASSPSPSLLPSSGQPGQPSQPNGIALDQPHSPPPSTVLAAAAEPGSPPSAAPHAAIPPHLQGLAHWNHQRAQWLSKRPAEPVPHAAPTDLKSELYPVVYHKMVRECRLLAPGKRLRLKDAFKLIVLGWKEDGLLPKNFVSAPASPPLRAAQPLDRSRPTTSMGDPSMSRSSSTTPPAVGNGSVSGFLGLSALWKGITSSLPG